MMTLVQVTARGMAAERSAVALPAPAETAAAVVGHGQFDQRAADIALPQASCAQPWLQAVGTATAGGYLNRHQLDSRLDELGEHSSDILIGLGRGFHVGHLRHVASVLDYQ